MALSLEGFGVSFGERVVLASVDLKVPSSGVLNLVGPSGTGKSTLIRTLSGLNNAQPAMCLWGTARLDDEELELGPNAKAISNSTPLEPGGIAHVLQDARFLTATVRENLASRLPDRSQLTRVQQVERLEKILVAGRAEDLIEHLDADAISLDVGMQRRLAIVQACMADPAIVCLDECTAGIPESQVDALLLSVAAQAERRTVIFVTHKQEDALKLGGRTALVAGGRVQEDSPTDEFYAHPSTPAGSTYVRTGTCRVPGPTASREELADSVPPPPPLPDSAIKAVASRHVGPTGFYWIQPGRLGGCPRPGIVASLEHDLQGLKRLGISVLVTLEETRTVPIEACEALGIESLHFPIVDMRTPSAEDARVFCADVELRMSRGTAVALHCRAGLGRTGTMLACQLLWTGSSPLDALERVRDINPKYIQSTEQVEFLSSYAQWLSEMRESPRPSSNYAREPN